MIVFIAQATLLNSTRPIVELLDVPPQVHRLIHSVFECIKAASQVLPIPHQEMEGLGFFDTYCTHLHQRRKPCSKPRGWTVIGVFLNSISCTFRPPIILHFSRRSRSWTRTHALRPST